MLDWFNPLDCTVFGKLSIECYANYFLKLEKIKKINGRAERRKKFNLKPITYSASRYPITEVSNWIISGTNFKRKTGASKI